MRPSCQVTSVLHKKSLKLYKLEFFLCALMTAYSSETRLIIYKFPRSICMSFTKYVEVAEKSAIMNMLPAKVTV